MAGIAVASTGHSHPKVVKAIKDASEKFLHICATDFYYEVLPRLCGGSRGFVPGMGTRKYFLTNSGTEAVEGAIKLVRHHTKRLNHCRVQRGLSRPDMGAVSLTSSKVEQRRSLRAASTG